MSTALCLVALPLRGEQLAEASGIEATNGTAGLAEHLDLSNDWPWWRGPTRDGAAATGQSPLIRWNDRENVLWSVPVPGRGHGSPTVVGNQVWIATADLAEGTQSVLCYDRRTGQSLAGKRQEFLFGLGANK